MFALIEMIVNAAFDLLLIKRTHSAGFNPELNTINSIIICLSEVPITCCYRVKSKTLERLLQSGFMWNLLYSHLLFCNFLCKMCCASLSPICTHDLSCSLVEIQVDEVINHACSSGPTARTSMPAPGRGSHLCPTLPASQRWQMCHLQWKYWELPGHLSGNIWAIWKITFCKWTQIKMYVARWLCVGSVSA